MIAIKLKTTNDRNGNPRRVFVVIQESGEVFDAVDEGYGGLDSLYEKYPLLRTEDYPSSIPEFQTTPWEYRMLIKQFKGAKS